MRRPEDVYAELPALWCKGKCHDSCGPVVMSSQEADVLGVDPDIPVTPHDANTGVCAFLTPEKRCAVYGQRPLVCRLFGMVKAMRCPHGCVPAWWVTDDRARRWLEELGP